MARGRPVQAQLSTEASLQDFESKLLAAPHHLHEPPDLPVGLPSAAVTGVLAQLQESLPAFQSPRSSCARKLSRRVPEAERTRYWSVRVSWLWPLLWHDYNWDLFCSSVLHWHPAQSYYIGLKRQR